MKKIFSLLLLLFSFLVPSNIGISPKALLIHGFTGSPTGVWIPWMKQELESRGYEVFAPEMPHSFRPVLKEWVDTLAPYVKALGKNDVIVAHSLGTKAAISAVLENKQEVGRVILVASAIGEWQYRDWQKMKREWKNDGVDFLKKFWEFPTNPSTLSSYADVVLILSDDDPVVSLHRYENFSQEWKFKLWHGYGHFTDSVIPELLREVVSRYAAPSFRFSGEGAFLFFFRCATI